MEGKLARQPTPQKGLIQHGAGYQEEPFLPQHPLGTQTCLGWGLGPGTVTERL